MRSQLRAGAFAYEPAPAPGPRLGVVAAEFQLLLGSPTLGAGVVGTVLRLARKQDKRCTHV